MGLDLKRFAYCLSIQMEIDSDDDTNDPMVRAHDIEFVEGEEHLAEFITNDSDYDGRRLVTSLKVPGNIHKVQFQAYWQDTLNPTQMVRDTILKGYRLPFKAFPPRSVEFKNNRSARLDDSFVRAELNRLCKLGVISKVNYQPHLVLPLSSVVSKKKRLVVDASRHLNKFLEHRRVRLSDLRDIPNIIKPNMYLGSFDLDSGYWHLSIAEEYKTYLGVHILDQDTGEPIFYVWNNLFLGVSDAVFIFTAILKPVRVRIAQLGVPSIMYLDDILYGGSTLEESLNNKKLVHECLSRAGFVISEEKSVEPSRKIRFLGLIICTETMQFLIPEDKILKLEDFARNLLTARRVRVRDMARFLGYLNSVAKAVGPVIRLRARGLYNWLAECLQTGSYNHHCKLSDYAKQELEFWLFNIRDLNGFPISPVQTVLETRVDELLMVTDASEDGGFGFVYSDQFEVVLRKAFDEEEKRKSSTFRELKALSFIYSDEATMQRFIGKKILHLTDNSAVVDILANGSRKPELLEMAVDIYNKCRRFKVMLDVEWRPRTHYLLQLADEGSKSFDSSSVSLDFNSFGIILEYFPEVEIKVDAMAEFWNKKSIYYFSKSSDPFSSGVNFFAQRLDPTINYYIFPPPGRILAAILHLSKFGAQGLLVIPYWPAGSFMVNILPDGAHFAPWCEKFLRFRPSGWCHDINIRSTTFRNPVTFDILVLKFDFKRVNPSNFFSSIVARNVCVNHGCKKCLPDLCI